jgi:hypothetical protein
LGKELKRLTFKRRSTKKQLIYEKSHLEKVNHNYTEIPSHPSQDYYSQVKKNSKCWWDCGEKRNTYSLLLGILN